MVMKIALAAFACSGTLLALMPTSATAAPLSGVSQAHGPTMLDNPLLQKVHRWRRRGWAAPYYGMATGMAMGLATGTATRTISLISLLTDRTTTAATALHRRRPRPTIIIGRTGGLTIRSDRD